MIKKTAIVSAALIHAIHGAVRWLLISLAVLSLVVVAGLMYGITIDRAEIGGFNVEKLYLKLDKKLTLRAERVRIPVSKAKPSFSRIDKTFDNIRYIFALFDEISLYRVDFADNRFAVFYADNILYLRSDDYEIAGSLSRQGTRLIATVPMLYVRRFGLYVQGMLTYDYANERLEVEGDYEIHRISGAFRALKRGDDVLFALNSNETDEINATVRRFGLPEAIEAWIVRKVKAKRYKLAYLKGRLHVKSSGAIELVPSSIKARVDAYDVHIRFHDDLPAATAEHLEVSFKPFALSFRLTKPTYQGRSLEGTSLTIRHLGDAKPATLVLDLHAVSDMEDEVQRILKAYGLTVPVRHNGKANRVRVALRIPLQKRKRGIRAEVWATLDHGMLSIGSFRLPVCGGGEIHYKEGIVHLQKVCVQDWWYEGEVQGRIDVHARRGVLDVDVKRLALGAKHDPFLLIKRQRLPLMIGFEHDISVDVAPLGLHLLRQQGAVSVRIDDLGKLRPYVRSALFDAKGGNVTFRTEDMRRITFKGTVEKDSCIFYGEKGTCFVRIPIEGHYNASSGSVSFRAFGERFSYDGTKRHIRVSRIHIDLKRLLEQRARAEKKQSATFKKTLTIEGKKSQIRYGRYRLVTDRYDIKIFPNGDIKAFGSLDGDVVKFQRKQGRFYVSAHRIKDKMLHPLIGFDGLKRGRYSLKLQGDPDKELRGRIIVEGGVLSDFKAYNNTLAFINAVPALATLNRPGFSKEGFAIDAGVVKYRINGEILTLEKVYLKGKTATVTGKGSVNLETGKLNIDLAVRTVKDFAKIVGNIPLVGYLLLGEDKSVTIGLKVTGTLKDPKIETSVAQDILTMPFRFIERVITSPKLLDDTPTLPDLPPRKTSHTPPQETTDLF